MINLSATLKEQKDNIFPAWILLMGVIGGAFCFSPSYLFHSNVIIGLLLFPLLVFISGPQRNNYVYLLFVLLSGCLALIYGIRIAYFFTLAFFILWLIEYFIGKCNPLLLFLLFFMSPVFTQVITILGFPLRLQLSKIAGTILPLAGVNAHVEGNIIILDNAVFSVDEACMGLNMLAMSMLIAAFMLWHWYRTTGKQLTFLKLTAFFLIVFVLNIITNLFRIVILVLFRIPPGNNMHEFVGLICFTFYSVVPAYFISAWVVNNGSVSGPTSSSKRPLTTSKKAALLFFALAVLVTGIGVGVQKASITTAPARVSFAAGKSQLLNGGITKISNEQLLIYVKPIPQFFTGEHTPLMCWKGSGYTFRGIKETVVEGKMIYSGKLVKQQEELCTAWWYSNGKIQTISQLDWRMRMLKGENKFCLVNITAKDEETLLKSIIPILNNNSLTIDY